MTLQYPDIPLTAPQSRPYRAKHLHKYTNRRQRAFLRLLVEFAALAVIVGGGGWLCVLGWNWRMGVR